MKCAGGGKKPKKKKKRAEKKQKNNSGLHDAASMQPSAPLLKGHRALLHAHPQQQTTTTCFFLFFALFESKEKPPQTIPTTIYIRTRQFDWCSTTRRQHKTITLCSSPTPALTSEHQSLFNPRISTLSLRTHPFHTPIPVCAFVSLRKKTKQKKTMTGFPHPRPLTHPSSPSDCPCPSCYLTLLNFHPLFPAPSSVLGACRVPA